MLSQLKNETNCLLDRLRSFSELTGTSFEYQFHAALQMYLEIEADPIAEEFVKPRRPKLRRIK